MKRPGFYEGVLVAVIASVAGVVLYDILTMFFGIAFSARAMAAVVGTAYLVYLLWRSTKKSGRISAVLFWAVSLFGLWLFDPSFVVYLILLMAVLWLIRSFAYYRSILSALADFGLSGLGFMAGLWAYLASGSLLLALWTLFLVQALFALIPMQWSRSHQANQSHQDDTFLRAHRNAEAALRKLTLN